METGTKANTWKLKTPPLSSEYEMYKDVIVCVVGKTTLLYDYRCIADGLTWPLWYVCTSFAGNTGLS